MPRLGGLGASDYAGKGRTPARQTPGDQGHGARPAHSCGGIGGVPVIRTVQFQDRSNDRSLVRSFVLCAREAVMQTSSSSDPKPESVAALGLIRREDQGRTLYLLQ